MRVGRPLGFWFFGFGLVFWFDSILGVCSLSGFSVCLLFLGLLVLRLTSYCKYSVVFFYRLLLFFGLFQFQSVYRHILIVHSIWCDYRFYSMRILMILVSYLPVCSLFQCLVIQELDRWVIVYCRVIPLKLSYRFHLIEHLDCFLIQYLRVMISSYL